MSIEVSFSDNPNWVLKIAREFLRTKPVEHNLILTLILNRIDDTETGRYWVISKNNIVEGVVVQTPISSRVVVTPMTSVAISEVVNKISNANIPLPGVAGEAATTACFAGEWAERNKTPVIPFLALRLYEVDNVQEPPTVKGHLRKAESDDRDLLIDWISCFSMDIGEHNKTIDETELKERHNNTSRLVDRHLSNGLLWLWEDSQPLSLIARTDAVEDVVQVKYVYTPPEHRNNGYATACVTKISKQIRNEGYRCILYTDLTNPVSNSIYRRIGYRAVSDTIQYIFH